MNDIYKTIKDPSEGIYREKGSRFMAFAFPVSGETEIGQRLGELRKKYHDARHHCYAWRLDAGMDRYRTNDDGEPSGSAGQPILGQIRSRELTQVLVVVVRYFGGTLLGVGGLIRAYRSAAADALDRARIIDYKVEEAIILDFGYGAMNAVMRIIKEYNLKITEQKFDTACTMVLTGWKRNLPAARKGFSAIEGCHVSKPPSGKL
jgi:uncharacterized YigZ family protein